MEVKEIDSKFRLITEERLYELGFDLKNYIDSEIEIDYYQYKDSDFLLNLNFQPLLYGTQIQAFDYEICYEHELLKAYEELINDGKLKIE